MRLPYEVRTRGHREWRKKKKYKKKRRKRQKKFGEREREESSECARPSITEAQWAEEENGQSDLRVQVKDALKRNQ